MTISAAELVATTKGALVDRIKALPAYATPKIPVTWSHPWRQLEKTCAWIGDFDGPQEWATFGGRGKEIKDASFEFVIFHSLAGGDAEKVERFALDLLRVVEEDLRVNETAGLDLGDLAGCKNLRLEVSRFELQGGANDQARAVRINAAIALYARI